MLILICSSCRIQLRCCQIYRVMSCHILADITRGIRCGHFYFQLVSIVQVFQWKLSLNNRAPVINICFFCQFFVLFFLFKFPFELYGRKCSVVLYKCADVAEAVPEPGTICRIHTHDLRFFCIFFNAYWFFHLSRKIADITRCIRNLQTIPVLRIFFYIPVNIIELIKIFCNFLIFSITFLTENLICINIFFGTLLPVYLNVTVISFHAAELRCRRWSMIDSVLNVRCFFTRIAFMRREIFRNCAEIDHSFFAVFYLKIMFCCDGCLWCIKFFCFLSQPCLTVI